MILTRRTALTVLAAALALPVAVHADEPTMLVSKSPTCGCCSAWVEHMRLAGFDVEVADVEQDVLYALKTRLGVQPQYASCHTAQIDGYVIEGHVPAADVRKLLAERPACLGLAVPGMPIGSPGMEMGNQRDAYDTILIGGTGTASVFVAHR